MPEIEVLISLETAKRIFQEGFAFGRNTKDEPWDNDLEDAAWQESKSQKIYVGKIKTEGRMKGTQGGYVNTEPVNSKIKSKEVINRKPNAGMKKPGTRPCECIDCKHKWHTTSKLPKGPGRCPHCMLEGTVRLTEEA